jgi:hypothetical protein
MAGGETVGKRPSGRRSNYRRDHGEASSVGEAGGRRGRLVVKEKETDFQFFFCLYFIRGYFWSRIVCSLRVYYGLGCVGLGLGGGLLGVPTAEWAYSGPSPRLGLAQFVLWSCPSSPKATSLRHRPVEPKSALARLFPFNTRGSPPPTTS